MLLIFEMELFFLTFRYPAVGLRQWSLLRAGREVILLAFEMELFFSTFRCLVVGLRH